MTFPTGTRRRLPQGGATRTSYVDLWPADQRGDLFQGFVRVPERLVGTKEHTNERLEFLSLIDANLKRWVEWKSKQGWKLNGTPKVSGPYEPPTPDAKSAPVDEAYGPHKRYVITARFTRETPLWIPLDGMLWIREQADMYGVDLFDSGIKDTGQRGVPHIEDDTPAHNPMEFAAERREALGLTREELLWEEPEA